MTGVFRIGLNGSAIFVEHWRDWDAFDASRARPSGPADLARVVEGPGLPTRTTGSSFEIQRLRVSNGMGAHALRLVTADLTAWQRAGAELLGLYEVVHGHDLPALLLILDWKDAQAALSAQRQVESDPDVIERYRADRAATRRSAIRAVGRTLGCTLILSTPDGQCP